MTLVQVMRRSSRVDLAVRADPCSVAAGPGSPSLSLRVLESSAHQACLSKGDLDISDLPCSTRWLTSRYQPSSVARTERSFPIASMDRIHPLESIRSVIHNALPNITVKSIRPLPSCRLLRFFSVTISDGRTLVLSLPPSPSLRLLRSERGVNLSETLVTKWILDTILEPSTQGRSLARGSIAIRSHIEDQSRENKSRASLEEAADSREYVLRFLPVLVTHPSSSSELGSPFNVFELPKGVTISELSTPLTTSERRIVDFQRGQLMRHLSEFTSPNGVFGPAIAVISPRLPSTDLHAAQLASLGLRGADTWRQAFHSLLEGVLRDAEDMAVTISYEPIRGYFSRLGYLLDGVTTARLVILDANDESNVLVSRSAKAVEEEGGTPSQPRLDQAMRQSGRELATEEPTRERSTVGNETGEPSDAQPPSVAVTGLRDWSNCIFGDPLFAEVFSQGTTSEFINGFRGDRGLNASSRNEGRDDNDLENVDLVEDPENAATRLLLYECYHATVGVVKQFYRPGPNSSDREIAARRRLATALKRLEIDEDAAGKRARRPSANVEAWPVKKPKGGDRPSPSA